MSDELKLEQSENYQMKCGVTLGILAAIMAVNSIGGGRWGAEEIKGSNEKGTAYAWYQAKSIKESIIEGHRDSVLAQLKGNQAQGAYKDELEKDLSKLNNTLNRYDKEKKEIMLGSNGVGKENWVIEQNGALGNVTGVEDWQRKVKTYEEVGDIFDMSAMFLQLSLVLGSISLLLNRQSVRNGFYNGMIVLGVIGTDYLAQAFSMVGW